MSLYPYLSALKCFYGKVPSDIVLKYPSLIGDVWLRLSDGGWVNGERLARELGVSKVAVWKAMDKLKSLGYSIESGRGRGYRLISSPNLPHPWQVARYLKTKRLGSIIIFIDSVASTQDVIKGMEKEGIVVFAGKQEKGRGRLGRTWLSTEKDLKFSLLLKPQNVPPQRMGLLSLIAGLAVCRAVGGRLKWPNDVLLDGRKVAGILIEGEAQQDRLEKVYVGIGINVNSVKGLGELGATSLKIYYSREFGLAEVAAKVLSSLEPIYTSLVEGRSPLREIKEVMDTLGRRVKVISFDEEFGGVAKDVDENGSLIVDEDSKVRRVSAGDVIHLRA